MKHNRILIMSMLLTGLLLVSTLAMGYPSARDEVVIALPSEPKSLDAVAYPCIFSGAVIVQIFEPLIWLDTELRPTNRRLAESWEILDPVTYIFHIRRGVKFHDGHELTAEDVKFTFEANKCPVLAPPRIADFAVIERIEIIDDFTVKIVLREPHAPFMTDAMTANIVPKHFIEEVGWDEFSRNPIGTGPYKFVEWRSGDFIELRRNENYWGELANIETVKFRFILEPAVGVMAMKALDIDFLYEVPGGDFAALGRTPGVAVNTFKGLNYRYLGLNNAIWPFNDVRIRQAINYGICIYMIVELWYPLAIPATGPIPPFVWGYTADVRRFDRNVERAKELLAEAGYPDGFEVTLTTSPGTRAMEEAVLTQAMLAEIGVRVIIEQVEWGVYLDMILPGPGLPVKTQMNRIGWTGMVDPWSFMEFLMSGSGWNYVSFYNPEFDRVMEEAVRVVDIERRKEHLAAAQRILLEYVPYVFLFHETRARAFNENLGGLTQWVEANGFGPLAQVSEWYWEED